MRWYKQVVEVTPAAVAPNLPLQMTFPTGLSHKQLCILFCPSLAFGLISHLLFIMWSQISTQVQCYYYTRIFCYKISISKTAQSDFISSSL